MRAPFQLSLVSLLLALALPAGAQTRSLWSIQGSVLYAGLEGEAYSGTDPGPGFEAQIRRRLSPLWSLGCGFQGTYHSLSAFSGDVSLQGIFCEPRRIVDINSDVVFPYVSARGAVLRQSLSSGTLHSSADGATINVGAGLMVPFGNTASDHPTLLEFGGSAGYTTFGEYSTVDPSGTRTGSTGSGWNFVLRVGIAIGLGGSKP
jgi:hypothetical protein